MAATLFQTTEAWKTAYPDAHAGVLAIRNVINPPSHPGLDKRKQELEDEIRARYAGQDRSALKAIPTIRAYQSYYARFQKTYHVQLQLESIAFKGKSIPSVAALVEAMFMAEVKNLLLTAGHDLDRLELPATLSVASGEETYTKMGGQIQTLKAGDMYIADRQGVISDVIYGPDERTQIRPETRDVLFTVYAPPGIEAEQVEAHLGDIEQNVRLIAPQSETELLEVVGTK